MTAIPKIAQLRRVFTGFGNKTRIEGDQPGRIQGHDRLDQRPIQADKVKRLIKLTRIRARRVIAVAAQIAEGDLAAQR